MCVFNIYLNCSQIAIITRDNKYTPLEEYTQILLKQIDKNTPIPKSYKELLNNYISAKKISKETVDMIENITINTTFDDVKNIANKYDRMDIDNDVKLTLNKYLNTIFGTKHEEVILKAYSNRYGYNVSKPQEKYTKFLFAVNVEDIIFNIYVHGYIDGINTTLNEIVEIKTRTRELLCDNVCIRPYEKIQCYFYMYILDLKSTTLIENYNDKYNEISISFNYNQFNIYTRKIKNYFKNYFFERYKEKIQQQCQDEEMQK